MRGEVLAGLESLVLSFVSDDAPQKTGRKSKDTPPGRDSRQLESHLSHIVNVS